MVTSIPTVVSIQVGLPRAHAAGDDKGAPWLTGIAKAPVTGAVWVGLDNLSGDGRAAAVHAGRDRAVLAYSAGHYAGWRTEFPAFGFPHGSFGENLTIKGQAEDDVCIGDIYAIGDAVIQVSLPRSPCASLSRHTGLPTLLARVQEMGRFGWLCRVLAEGHIESGQPLRLHERPHPDWTVARTYRVYRQIKARDPRGVENARALTACESLTPSWRQMMAEGVAKFGPQGS